MLSKKQNIIMKTLYSQNTLSERELNSLFGIDKYSDILRTLYNEKFIRCCSSDKKGYDYILITESGKAYTENLYKNESEQNRTKFHLRINTAISIAAIIIAIASLCVSIAQLVQGTMK